MSNHVEPLVLMHELPPNAEDFRIPKKKMLDWRDFHPLTLRKKQLIISHTVIVGHCVLDHRVVVGKIQTRPSRSSTSRRFGPLFPFFVFLARGAITPRYGT